MHDAQVIIAGAGPVGTVAAYYLAHHGIKVVLCEAGNDCAQDLRASTFHPPIDQTWPKGTNLSFSRTRVR